MIRRPPRSTLFPSPPLFQSAAVAAQNEPAVERKNLLLSVELAEELPLAKAEAGSIYQALSNYVSNAIKFHSRSEEHTSELQSPCNLVCRLLLEKKKTRKRQM